MSNTRAVKNKKNKKNVTRVPIVVTMMYVLLYTGRYIGTVYTLIYALS